MLGNTPNSFVEIYLEDAKSFLFELRFQEESGAGIDVTGMEFTLAVDNDDDSNAITLDGIFTQGFTNAVQFPLQAADLDLDPGNYPFDVTMVDAGYSIPVTKGVIILGSNADEDSSNVYTGGLSSEHLLVTLGRGRVASVTMQRTPGPQGDKGDKGDKGDPSGIFVQPDEPPPGAVPPPDAFIWVDTDAPSPGVAPGGHPGEVLIKRSDADWDIAWGPMPKGDKGDKGDQGDPGPPGGMGPLDALQDVTAPANTPAGKVLGTTATGSWEPVDPPSGGMGPLDALQDVTAPANTPAGKVLGTTATGSWGPVDPPSGGGGGTYDHSLLTNRSAPESHPISAITGLQAALDARSPLLVVASLDDVPPGTPSGTLIVVADTSPPPPPPDAHPVIVTYTQFSGSGSASLSRPAGAANGDLLLVFLASQASTAVTGYTQPAGFSDAAWPPPVPATSDLRFTAASMKRISDIGAEPSSYTFTVQGAGSSRINAAMLLIRGADPVSPVAVYTAPFSNPTSMYPKIPGAEVPVDDCLALGFVHTVQTTATDTTHTVPAGWTVVVSLEHPAGQSATSSTDRITIYQQQVATGTLAQSSVIANGSTSVSADSGSLVVIQP